MKTLKDLEEMKNKPNIPFGNQYDYLFMELENDYIKSRNSRIKDILKEWDPEARELIIEELIRILLEGGMQIDQDDIDELMKL